MTSSFILHNSKPFLNQIVTCDKSGYYTTTRDYQLSGWTEKQLQSTSQSQTCTKRGHGLCLGICCCSDPLQLSESWCNHEIWEVCSILLSRSIERAHFFSTTMPDWMFYHQCFKNWTNWATNWALYTIFTRPLSSRLPLLQVSQKLFAGKTLPQLPGGRKCFPRVSWILKHVFFLSEAWIFMLHE